MHAFFADRQGPQLPEGHRFPFQKYGLLLERVERELGGIALQEARLATEGELALAHAPHYISAVLEGHLNSTQLREIGFPWSPRLAERARRSVGATIEAARLALAEGISANLAGGTHHASAERGGGYCVFNDVGVAARLMQSEWHRAHRRLLRVAVIDLDVHQGNGTASIFCDDPTVFTLSMHGEKNFPFRKEPSDLDVDLPDGCGDAPYLEALDAALSQLWARHADGLPGLIFYLAGADPHEGDRLGRLKLSTAGLAERDRRVLDAAVQRRIPVALAMAGGYGRDLADTVQVQVNTLTLAQQAWERWNNHRP